MVLFYIFYGIAGMVVLRKIWYLSGMNVSNAIPAYGLYGDPGPFPDVMHYETFSARAPDHDWSIKPHRHGQIAQLFVIEGGAAKAQIDGMPFALTPGDFLFVPALCVHAFEFEPNTDGAVFSFPMSVVGSLGPNAQEILPALGHVIIGQAPKDLMDIVRLMKRAADESGHFRAQQLVALSHAALVQIAQTHALRQRQNSGAKSGRILELDALITEQMANGWSPSDYAGALSMSTGHLSRICRRATGMGASAYIEARIMSEACRLLAFTQLPISMVGYRLGYADPSYFSKRFRAACGQTPTEYRGLF